MAWMLRGEEGSCPSTAVVTVPERVCLPAEGIYAGTFGGPEGVERVPATIVVGAGGAPGDAGRERLVEIRVAEGGDARGEIAKVAFLDRVSG